MPSPPTAGLDSAPTSRPSTRRACPGCISPSGTAFWLPKGTPANVIAKLNAAVVSALAEPPCGSASSVLGQEIPPREQQTPEALRAKHKAEIAKWWPIPESGERQGAMTHATAPTRACAGTARKVCVSACAVAAAWYGPGGGDWQIVSRTRMNMCGHVCVAAMAGMISFRISGGVVWSRSPKCSIRG